MRWIALQACITDPGPMALDEDVARRAMVSMALGLTPRVAIVDEAVLMDVTGSLRLFGGLANLGQLMDELMSQWLASSQGAAHVLRAQGTTSLIALARLRMLRKSSSTGRPRVADLPMHTLTAALEHLDVLERIGCRSWDDLLRLPRDGMARRFGAGLLEALDRARGQAPDNYEWLVLPEQFEEKLELDALVTHAPALMAGVEKLLVNLQAWLLGRQSGLCALKLTWHLDKRRDVPPTGELEIRTAQPAQDLRHMSRLVSEHLAQQKLLAPVHSLSLQSLATEFLVDSAAATSSLLMEARKQGDSAVELIERLSARLGDDHVQAWRACAEHRPEQMQQWVHARDVIATITRPEPAPTPTPARAKSSNRKKIPSAKGSQKFDALFPSWLLPEPIKLTAPGNSPVWQGKLTRLAGPQRIEQSGWLMGKESLSDLAHERESPPAMRDYFVYRSEQGALLWVYSERLKLDNPDASSKVQRRAWFLQGFFA